MPIAFRQERISTLKSPSFRAFVLLYCYVRKVIRINSESSLRSELTISLYFLSSCLGVRARGSKPNQSSRPGNSNTDSSHHVVLQAFVYKIAKPREATNILEYQNIISTQKWKSAASNQQSHMVRSGKKSTKSFGTCLATMTLLLLAPRPTSQRPPKSSPCRGDPVRRMVSRPSTQKPHCCSNR